LLNLGRGSSDQGLGIDSSTLVSACMSLKQITLSAAWKPVYMREYGVDSDEPIRIASFAE
jgi:hypothetical protein